MEIKSGKIKDNSRRKKIPQQAKEARRQEAEVRQAAYSKLSPQEKLKRLNTWGFNAQRERARLEKQISTGGKS